MKILLAVLPPLLIAYYIYKKDKYDVEPRGMIIKSFLFGCLTVVPVLFIYEFIDQSVFPNLFLYVFFGIAFVEEGVKYLFLKKFLYSSKDFNEPMDGIVYAVMVSLGFATVENIQYVIYNFPDSSFEVGFKRMFTAIPLHALCGVIMGYFVGLAKFSSNKNQLIFKGIFLAVLLHCVYNYYLFAGDSFIFSILSLIAAAYYSNKAIKILQIDSKKRNLY